jgi:hypothetical protein
MDAVGVGEGGVDGSVKLLRGPARGTQQQRSGTHPVAVHPIAPASPRAELAGTGPAWVELVGHASCVTLRCLHQPEAVILHLILRCRSTVWTFHALSAHTSQSIHLSSNTPPVLQICLAAG